MFHLRYIYAQYQQVFYTPGPWIRKTCPLSTLVFPFQNSATPHVAGLKALELHPTRFSFQKFHVVAVDRHPGDVT